MDTRDTQEFLRRAQANAKTALLIVREDDQRTTVEAVSQVQQACEKATKAVMLANGITYAQATAMGHNTIGAFVKLIAQMLLANPSSEEIARVLLKEDAVKWADALTKVVLSGRQNKTDRKKVTYAFKQIFQQVLKIWATRPSKSKNGDA